MKPLTNKQKFRKIWNNRMVVSFKKLMKTLKFKKNRTSILKLNNVCRFNTSRQIIPQIIKI